MTPSYSSFDGSPPPPFNLEEEGLKTYSVELDSLKVSVHSRKGSMGHLTFTQDPKPELDSEGVSLVKGSYTGQPPVILRSGTEKLQSTLRQAISNGYLIVGDNYIPWHSILNMEVITRSTETVTYLYRLGRG